MGDQVLHLYMLCHLLISCAASSYLVSTYIPNPLAIAISSIVRAFPMTPDSLIHSQPCLTDALNALLPSPDLKEERIQKREKHRVMRQC
jgi:hypothetical protein